MMLHSEAISHMDKYEFIGNLVLLIVGGNDTTRNTMSGLAYGLDKYPGERAKLEADPSLIPNAVSAIIRWQTPLAHMRSEEHTSELQSLMRISYAVFCLQKKTRDRHTAKYINRTNVKQNNK